MCGLVGGEGQQRPTALHACIVGRRGLRARCTSACRGAGMGQPWGKRRIRGRSRGSKQGNSSNLKQQRQHLLPLAMLI